MLLGVLPDSNNNLSQLDSVKIIVKLVWGQNLIAKRGRVDSLLVVFFSLSATLN